MEHSDTNFATFTNFVLLSPGQDAAFTTEQNGTCVGRDHAGGEMEEAKGWDRSATEALGRGDLDLWVDESSLGTGDNPSCCPGVLQVDQEGAQEVPCRTPSSQKPLGLGLLKGLSLQTPWALVLNRAWLGSKGGSGLLPHTGH